MKHPGQRVAKKNFLYQHSEGIGHELLRHFENVVGKCGGHDNDLHTRRNIPVAIVDLVFESPGGRRIRKEIHPHDG